MADYCILLQNCLITSCLKVNYLVVLDNQIPKIINTIIVAFSFKEGWNRFFVSFGLIHRGILSLSGTSEVPIVKRLFGILIDRSIFELFGINTKLTMLSTLALKTFSSTKKVTSSVTRSGDHWFKGLMIIPLS